MAVLLVLAALCPVARPVLAAEDDPATKALFAAAASGDLAALEAAQPDAAALARFSAEKSMTLLQAAAQAGHVDVVRWLLARGADPNLGTVFGFPPIGAAAYGGHLAVVDLLLASGADPNRAHEKTGWAPLFAAAQEKRAKVGIRLLEHGADPNVRDNDGATPLSIAVSRPQNREFIKALLAKGADPESKDNYGYSVTYRAETSEDPEIMAMVAEAIRHRQAGGAALSDGERFQLADEHFRRGMAAAWAGGRDGEALGELNAAIEIAGDVPILLMHRAMVYKQMDDERARDDIFKLEDLLKSLYAGTSYDAQAGLMYFLLAVGKFRGGDTHGAKSTAEMAVEHLDRAGDTRTAEQARAILDAATRIIDEQAAARREPFRFSGDGSSFHATSEDWSRMSEAIGEMIDRHLGRRD